MLPLEGESRDPTDSLMHVSKLRTAQEKVSKILENIPTVKRNGHKVYKMNLQK